MTTEVPSLAEVAFHGLVSDPSSEITPLDVSDRPADFDQARLANDVSAWEARDDFDGPTFDSDLRDDLRFAGDFAKDFGDEDAIFGHGP
jgi:hypothetical protein